MSDHKGFTLIELAIFVVIIGILVAIAVPNFIALQDRAKEATTKSNLHTIQLAIEDYSVQHHSVYPVTAGDILGDLPNGTYLMNAFTKKQDVPCFGEEADSPGEVCVKPILKNEVVIGYHISAFGKKGIILTVSSQD